MTTIKKFFSAIFSSLIGKLSWEKPRWCVALALAYRQHTKRIWSIVAGIVLLLVLGIAGYWGYQKLPKPQLLAAQLYVPRIARDNDKQIPSRLVVVFVQDKQNNVITPEQSNLYETADAVNVPDETSYVSVASLQRVGKTIKKGIDITPAIAGQWQWQSDKVLVFKPNAPWPAGQPYTVHFAKSLFKQTYKMPEWQLSFTTIPLSITTDTIKFFQDIAHPESYKTSCTVNFNYPIDTNSFAQHVQLYYPQSGEKVPYAISYSPGNWQAYIQADIKHLSDHEQYLKLNIDKNVKPAQAGHATTTPVEARVLIPAKSSVLKIANSSAMLVRNDKGQPEQIVTIETTTGVTTQALQKALHLYLLPRDYSAGDNTPIQKNYAWTNPGEVTTNMLTHSVDFVPIPTEHDYETSHSFKIHVEPNYYLYVAIDKGLVSYGEYQLALPYSAIVQAPDYPKEVNFLHQGSLLALTGEKKVSVIVRGLPSVKFTIARVLPDEVNHLVTQTSGDFQNPQFINDSFNATDISTLNSEIDAFNNSDPGKAQYMALDLAKYLKQQPFKLGLFLLKAEGWNPETKTATGNSNSRLILMTDMDLLVKNNADNSHDAFVQSITGGTPIAGAQVQVLGRNGIALISQTTDANGHAHLPSLQDFVDDKAPVAYVVSKDNDIAFMPYSRSDRALNYSRYDTGGETATHHYGLNAFLFSDRGLYRPGEKIHIGMIVKGNYAAATVPGLPLELTITDPRGMTVYDKKLMSNASGFLTEDYQPDTTALTGEYSVSLSITKDDLAKDQLGSTTVQVQDFEPDQLKISTHFLPAPTTSEGWVSPQNLKAEVQLWNLFGTPAAQRKITGQLNFAPQAFKFSAYPNTIFSDPYRDPAKPAQVFSENLTDIQTDEQGKAEFKLDLSRYAQSTYQLTLLTRGFAAEGGRGVTQLTSVMVSPLSYLIGYKADGDVSYIRQRDKRNVHFIAIDSALKKIAVPKLQIKIIKLNKLTTLAKQPDGSYQYQTVVQEHTLSQQPFAISPLGNDYVLPTDQVGDYKVQIFDQNHLMLSQLPFSVMGQGERAISKDSVLTVKLDKKDYAPGDTIQLGITAPYSGSGLITVERDKVYAFKWFKMNGASTVESITLPADFEGTGYVNVALIRDWNSDEIFMNPLSYSVQPFSVVPESRRSTITLNTPARVYPGKPLDIEYSTNKPSQIVVYAVDEGILQVADYKTPDPLGYYFRKRALSVDTNQIADQIIPKFIADREVSAVGGDGEEKTIASNLNPFARKLAPVVYWSGVLNADDKPQHVAYSIPDYFNGTLRIMAVAASTDAVGAAMKKTQVKNDYILTPSVPTFVAPQDQFAVNVTVANTTQLNTSITLSVHTSSQLKPVGVAQQQLTVPPEGEKTVSFMLKAKDLLGAADINFVATVDGKTFQQPVSLSVRPATAYQTAINSGYATSNANLAITRNLYAEFRLVKAVSSTNPFILLNGLKNYLDTYPYGCTEQLISRAFLQLTLQNQPGYADAEKFTAVYQKTMQMLRQRQTSEGGFAYWPGQPLQGNQQFATIYAADFLTEAKLRGNNVPQDMLSQVLAYLKNYAASNPTNMSEARLHAYAIYILTRNQIMTTDYIANLLAYFQQEKNNKVKNKNWQQDITTAYLAAAYQMLQNSARANELIAGYHLGQGNNKANNEMDDFYNPIIMDAQYIAVLANYFPERLRKLTATQLMPLVNNISSDELSSLTAATSALALSDFAKALPPELAANQSAIITIDKNNKEQPLTSAAVSTDVKKLLFKPNHHVGYFYQLIQAGFDKKPPANIIKSGLELYRVYQNKEGKAVTTANLGQELAVHVRVRTTDSQTVNNVAVVDLLPGGFELVPNSITEKDSGQKNLNYFDAREDRVVFYLTATPDLQEYTYQIRAINKGTFTIPPAFGAAMYQPKITAQTKAGTMVVK